MLPLQSHLAGHKDRERLGDVSWLSDLSLGEFRQLLPTSKWLQGCTGITQSSKPTLPGG